MSDDWNPLTCEPIAGDWHGPHGPTPNNDPTPELSYCQTCGCPCVVEGKTTRYYRPIEAAEEIAGLREEVLALREVITRVWRGRDAALELSRTRGEVGKRALRERDAWEAVARLHCVDADEAFKRARSKG